MTRVCSHNTEAVPSTTASRTVAAAMNPHVKRTATWLEDISRDERSFEVVIVHALAVTTALVVVVLAGLPAIAAINLPLLLSATTFAVIGPAVYVATVVVEVPAAMVVGGPEPVALSATSGKRACSIASSGHGNGEDYQYYRAKR